MSKINLSPYTIKVKEKNSMKCEDLENLFGKGISLLDVVKEIKSEYKTKPYKQNNSKKAFKFENKTFNYSINNVNIVQDIIYYGEYGVLRKIMNIETGEINPDDVISAEESPVFDLTFTYFQDSLVKYQSYIIVQSYSRMSYKTLFNKLLEDKLKSIFDIEITVDINPLINSELIELVENGGRIVEISLISNDIPKDPADLLLNSQEEKLEIKNTNQVNFSLTSSKGKSLISKDGIIAFERKLRDIVIDPKATPFYEVTKCQVNEIKIKVSTENKDYTVYLDSTGSEFKQTLPLNDNDIISDDGTINNGNILVIARDYVNIVVNKYRLNKY